MVPAFLPLSLLPAAAGFAASAAGVWLSIRLAKRAGIVDVPNARSSHASPTPRAGGLPMALAGLLAVAGWAWGNGGSLGGRGLETVLLFSFGMACLGFLDDLSGLSPASRFAVQVTGAGLLLAAGGYDLLSGAKGASGGLRGLCLLAEILWVVWMLNLYNFMDGIDGLAGGEAVMASAFFFLLFASRGEPGWAAANLAVGAAAGGFLVHNRPPAKVFMGDAGSAFLGGFFGMQTVVASLTTSVPFVALVLPFANFIGDTTVTLIRRMLRGEKWYAAHRSHFYQRMTDLGLSHGRVTGIEMASAAASCAAAAVYAGSGSLVRTAVIVLMAGALAAAGIRVAARERSGQGKE